MDNDNKHSAKQAPTLPKLAAILGATALSAVFALATYNVKDAVDIRDTKALEDRITDNFKLPMREVNASCYYLDLEEEKEVTFYKYEGNSFLAELKGIFPGQKIGTPHYIGTVPIIHSTSCGRKDVKLGMNWAYLQKKGRYEAKKMIKSSQDIRWLIDRINNEEDSPYGRIVTKTVPKLKNE